MTSFQRLFVYLLDDDYGLNEKSFKALLSFAEEKNEDISLIYQKVKATNGRFYLPVNYSLDLLENK